MKIIWKRDPGTKYLYMYGTTAGRFSAQIGESTNKGEYIWIIFHKDFRYAIHGDSAKTVDEAQHAAQEWLKDNTRDSA